jgi:hypothetical protein
MGIFSKSDEERQAIQHQRAAEENRIADQTKSIQRAAANASEGDRLIAYATVYALGGRQDSAIWGWEAANAEKALRSFMDLTGQ